MYSMLRSSLVLLVSCAILPTAFADVSTGRGEVPRLSVTVSPAHLFLPLAEVMGEYRLSEAVTAAAIAGVGRRTIEAFNQEVSSVELEAGAQFRYYPIGSFVHGMHVGSELLYEHVEFDEPLPVSVASVAAGGLTLGPFVGYKLITRSGFTFDAQGGVRYLVMEPQRAGPGPHAMLPDSERWMPLLNLNVGWSF